MTESINVATNRAFMVLVVVGSLDPTGDGLVYAALSFIQDHVCTSGIYGLGNTNIIPM